MTNEEMCDRIRSGENLMEELIANNTGIITKYARLYYPVAVQNRGVDMDDLLQAARIGMIDAVWKWNRERGQFLTCAAFYMRKEIRIALGIWTTKQRIENAAPPVSLHEKITDEADTLLVDTIADPNAIDPCEAAVKSSTAQIIHEEVTRLPDKQRVIVLLHTMQGKPLSHCADALGLSERDCRCRESKAIRALRKNKRIRDLCAYLDTAYHYHKGVAAFRSSWSSAVEDAVIRRESLLARIEESIAAFSSFDTTKLQELREQILARA